MKFLRMSQVKTDEHKFRQNILGKFRSTHETQQSPGPLPTSLNCLEASGRNAMMNSSLSSSVVRSFLSAAGQPLQVITHSV